MKKIISVLTMCLLLFGAVPALAAHSNNGAQVSGNDLVTSKTNEPIPGKQVQYSDNYVITIELVPTSVVQNGPIQYTNVDIWVLIEDMYGYDMAELVFRNCTYQTYHNSVDGYYYHYWTYVHDNYEIYYAAPGVRILDVTHSIHNTNVEGEGSYVTYTVTLDVNQGSNYSGSDSVYLPPNS